MAFTSLPPLSLYVHLPWCAKKCPYCDFNSHAAPAEIPAEAYVDALLADLDQALPTVWGRPLASVFMGGGTPSLFPPAAIRRLLSAIRARFNPAPDIEITLEANPGTLEAGRFAAFREAGVNRLSLGIQSFDDAMLTALGRIHDGATAHAAAHSALAAGFDSINLDLMYGLPEQGPDAAMQDLDIALGLGPAHISWYELTLEPNTVFWSHPPRLPDTDSKADIEATGSEHLVGAGFARYEISAWARSPTERCQHNLNYWHFGDYLGIGAGAHGKLTLAEEGAIERQARVRAPDKYLERAPAGRAIASRQRLTAADAACEFLLNALRLPAGFEPALFTERTAIPLAWLEAPLAAAEADGLLIRGTDNIRPSGRGLAFLNDLLAYFEEATAAWRTGRERIARIPVVTR